MFTPAWMPKSWLAVGIPVLSNAGIWFLKSVWLRLAVWETQRSEPWDEHLSWACDLLWRKFCYSMTCLDLGLEWDCFLWIPSETVWVTPLLCCKACWFLKQAVALSPACMWGIFSLYRQVITPLPLLILPYFIYQIDKKIHFFLH